MMRAIHLTGLFIALCATPLPALADGSSGDLPRAMRAGLADYVAAAARRFAIPESWIYAVIRFESGGGSRAISPKGACGLMQIMPPTWARLRARYGLGQDIFDPRDNILAGAAYLRELYARYGSPGLFAAYNAGPGRYEDYLYRGRPLPGETIVYVRNLTAADAPGIAADGLATRRPPSLDWAASALFAARSGASEVRATTRSDDGPPAEETGRPHAGTTVPAGLFPPLPDHPSR
jgi:hypothetical protein